MSPPARGRGVFGTLAYWLENARGLDREGWFGPRQIIDVERFWQHAGYRRSVANANLLTAVTGNGDTHTSQFIVVRHEADEHLYVIDHTISFSNYRNPRLRPSEWLSSIAVPALPRASIERLRATDMRDFDALTVLEQYRNADGRLVPADRTAPGAETERGLRWADGELQVGLTRKEIDLVYNRTQDLLERIARKEVRLFGDPTE